MEYKFNAQELYSKTNQGLDIFFKYVPDCIGCESSSSKKFKLSIIREEKTPSAVLYQTDESWIIKDFGGRSWNPISLVMKIKGFDFFDSLKYLYSEFNIPTNKGIVYNNISFKENKENFGTDFFRINVNEEYEHLSSFGPFVTPKIAMMYNVHEIASFQRITKSNKIMTVSSTENYPIFCYSPDTKKWAKTYCPSEFKRKDANGKTINYKHGYLGKKQNSYIHGLERILSDVDEETIDSLFRSLETAESKHAKNEILGNIKQLQVKNIIICSGGSDGLNVASLSDDYYPVWFNSESEQISWNDYQRLNKLCQNFYNLPDVDSSGKKYAYALSNKYWNLKTIWLPKTKLSENGKDFRDWLKHYTNLDKSVIKRQFENLLKVSLKCNFIDKNTDQRPRINLANFHYFLNSNNFYSYKPRLRSEDKNNEDSAFLIHLDEFKVSIPESSEIRKFTIDYLIEKGVDLEKINLVKKSRSFTPNELKTIDRIDLDFKNYEYNKQYFYFKNGTVCISPEEVKFSTTNMSNKYVWGKKVIQKSFSKEDKFFEYYKDEKGNNRVKILDKSCDFLCYLINASRVFWRKEIEEPYKTIEEQEEYRKKHLFTLNGTNLSDQEKIIQEQHFLNKCFALGYLLHRYKREDFAKFVYIMDDAVKGSDDEANGGTGKSLMIRSLKELLNVFSIDGRDKNLVNDKHLLGGLSLDDDLINLEDGRKGLTFDYFYNKTTSELNINPKNKGSISIPFEEAPKLVGTFNYGLSKNNGSDLRRILFVSFGNYYHYHTDEFNQERRVSDDFGYTLFQNWDDTKYNKFYNFLFQCCQLYLNNVNNEFKAPMDNITQNNLLSQIGDNFIEWASEYFLEEAEPEDSKFNKLLIKEEIYQHYSNSVGHKSSMGKNRFKKSLEKFCRLKGFVFNPDTLKNTQGRIKKNVIIPGSQKRTTKECFYIENKSLLNVKTNEIEIDGEEF
jgi:hypothetical protein